MTYEYEAGQVPVRARECVRCGKPLEPEAGAGGRSVGWVQPSTLSASIWVFQSRGAPPAAATEQWRCATCDRRYAFLPR